MNTAWRKRAFLLPLSLLLLLLPTVSVGQGAGFRSIANGAHLERGAAQLADALRAAGGCKQCGGELLQKIRRNEELWMQDGVVDIVQAARSGQLDIEAPDFVAEYPEVATVLKYLRDLPSENLPTAFALARAERIANAEERLVEDTPGCSQLLGDIGFLAGVGNDLKACAVHLRGGHAKPEAGTVGARPAGEPPPTPPDFVLESQAAHKEALDAGIDIIKRCGKDQACVRERLEEYTESSRFQSMFSKLCMGQHTVALKALAFDYMVNLTSLSLAYAASGEDAEFPFGYLATTIVSRAMYTELACRAQIAGRAAAPAPGAAQDPSFFRTTFTNYVTYLKYEPIYLGTYISMEFAEDAIRGKDLSETYDDILKEGAFVLVYDLAWANWKNVALLDPLYLRAFPKMRNGLNKAFEQGLLGRVVSRDGKMQILYATKGLPGGLAELAGRITVRGTDNFIFLNARQLFHNWAGSGSEPVDIEAVEALPPGTLESVEDTVMPWLPTTAEGQAIGDIETPPPPDSDGNPDT